MTIDIELVPPLVHPLARLHLADGRRMPGGRVSVCVVPDHDQTIDLDTRPRDQPRLGGDGAPGVGNLHTAARVSAEFPVVEWTLDTVSTNSTENICVLAYKISEYSTLIN